jgi:hypothetical protein
MGILHSSPKELPCLPILVLYDFSFNLIFERVACHVSIFSNGTWRGMWRLSVMLGSGIRR